MNRIERANRRMFGRDVSGGADWATEGAWCVRSDPPRRGELWAGLFLTCWADGGPGRDRWAVVRRSVASTDESTTDTELYEGTRWADAVRFARSS